MSNSAIVRLPQLAWYGDNTIEIDFPSSWDVTVCRSGGEEAAALDGDAFRKAFANPIGTSTIRELARGKKRVAILFDDACRPTPVADILPYVLDELSHAGIEDDDVRFIAALGAHGAMDGVALRKKLGDDVMARFLVYNHNPYELCTPLGTTSRGTPVAINTEVMRCDLKIGIGAIMPHLLTGFSGGPKIILPGVAAIETIGVNHNKWGGPGRTDIGHDEGNVLKADMDEAARMAGLDVKIDVLLNLRREVCRDVRGGRGGGARAGCGCSEGALRNRVCRRLRHRRCELLLQGERHTPRAEGGRAAAEIERRGYGAARRHTGRTVDPLREPQLR